MSAGVHDSPPAAAYEFQTPTPKHHRILRREPSLHRPFSRLVYAARVPCWYMSIASAHLVPNHCVPQRQSSLNIASPPSIIPCPHEVHTHARRMPGSRIYRRGAWLSFPSAGCILYIPVSKAAFQRALSTAPEAPASHNRRHVHDHSIWNSFMPACKLGLSGKSGAVRMRHTFLGYLPNE